MTRTHCRTDSIAEKRVNAIEGETAAMSDALNQVDLVFVVNTTGSMGAFVDAAQRQMIAMTT